MSADTASLGPLVRLWGLPASRLPQPTATGDELEPFLRAILEEAVPFIDGAAPKSGAPADRKVWKAKGVKASPQSAAKIEVSERVIGAKELAEAVTAAAAAAGEAGAKAPKAASEAWAVRRSVHTDAAQTGTASWDEFARCFRDEHAAAEEAFMPAVVATHAARVWDCSGVAAEVEVGGVRWGRFTLRLEEMRHQVGRPLLKDRTFPVLQMTASATVDEDDASTSPEFVVVSIPVPDFGKTDASKLASEKGAQVAVYVSVERIRKLPGGDNSDIEWLMATAGNAGGALPRWVQKMTMPGIVWKDVPLFLAWIAKERAKEVEGGAEQQQQQPDAEPAAAGAGAATAETAEATDAAAAPADHDEAAHDKDQQQVPPPAATVEDEAEDDEAPAALPVAAENPPTLPAMGETDSNWGAAAFDVPLESGEAAAKTADTPVTAAPAAESK